MHLQHLKESTAEQEDAEAQFNLGMRYLNGEGVPMNKKEAVKWLHLSAEQGHIQAEFMLGKAQYHLGSWYHYGKNVQQDYAKAAKWYRRAAENMFPPGLRHENCPGRQGIVGAQSRLGALYYEGKGVQQNYEKALKWWLQAAKQGDAMAQAALGVMYFRGEGVPQDYKEAYIWFFLAAGNGKAKADKWRDKAAVELSDTDLMAAQQEAEQRWHAKIQTDRR